MSYTVKVHNRMSDDTFISLTTSFNSLVKIILWLFYKETKVKLDMELCLR